MTTTTKKTCRKCPGTSFSQKQNNTPDVRNKGTTTKTYSRECLAGSRLRPHGNTMQATSKPKENSEEQWSLHPERIFVALEVDAIVLPLACRGVYSKVPGLPSSTSGWKVNGVMNLTTLLLYFTSGVAAALAGKETCFRRCGPQIRTFEKKCFTARY